MSTTFMSIPLIKSFAIHAYVNKNNKPQDQYVYPMNKLEQVLQELHVSLATCFKLGLYSTAFTSEDTGEYSLFDFDADYFIFNEEGLESLYQCEVYPFISFSELKGIVSSLSLDDLLNVLHIIHYYDLSLFRNTDLAYILTQAIQGTSFNGTAFQFNAPYYFIDSTRTLFSLTTHEALQLATSHYNNITQAILDKYMLTGTFPQEINDRR